MLSEISKYKLIAIIRTDLAEKTIQTAEACLAAGIKVIEIPLNTPNPFEIIKTLCKNSSMIVGAGTVLNAPMAQQAYQAGARFIVSPHTDLEIIEFCKTNRVTVIQGALTPSEILIAWNWGVDAVKIFPASALGGPKYIRSLQDPYPMVKYIPTGGITEENIPEYLKLGVAAVGLGGTFLKKDWINSYHFENITTYLKKTLGKIIDENR
jgi:2-dehydro-3-deoxyphosphogluconate aldolase/(4S)-4-hydroxy-2-oxoglutarate aldolase